MKKKNPVTPMRIIRHIVFIVGLILVTFAPTSEAAGFTEATQGLLSKNYSEKISAVKLLAATNDARSVVLLEALLGGDLYARKTDKALVIGRSVNGGYEIISVLTDDNLGIVKKNTLSKIRINNKMRGLIKSLLGSLTLSSKDRDLRLKAANAIFTGKANDMAEPLAAAVSNESDPTVAVAMKRALAAINLIHGENMEIRVQALTNLQELQDPEIRSMLMAEAQKLSDIENPSEAEKLLNLQIQTTIAKIDEKLAFLGVLESIFQGISLGSVLLLAAIGLAITFGVMGVINMAHGEMVMIGAYTTYVVQEICRQYAPGAVEYSIIMAVPAAFLVAGMCGVGIERSVIRFLYGRPLETLLATWGISLILQQLIRTIFGPTNKDVSSPEWLSGALEVTGGLSLTYNRIAIILFAAAVLIMLMIILRKTSFGLQMRAVTQNRRMAAAMGVKTSWVDAMTFGLGSGVAGMAGVALSQIDNVSPNLGQAYIIDSFMVVVFGGVGNLWGTLVGALSLGITNKFLEPYTGAVLAKILVLVAIILFIQKRPRGLFALKGRAVES
jgi:urea transport system permease protein